MEKEAFDDRSAKGASPLTLSLQLSATILSSQLSALSPQPCLTSASAQCSSSPAAMPPTVAAQHILLKGGDIDARSVAAEAIKTKIEAGDTTFEAGKMVAAFDAYVFNPASPIGEIAIVDTDFGTHLIKVLERSDKFDPKKTKTDGGYSL